jgi:hypothetical protein
VNDVVKRDRKTEGVNQIGKRDIERQVDGGRESERREYK